MKKRYMVLILFLCFMFGMTYGMNSTTSSQVSAKVNDVTSQISQYESQLSDKESTFIPLSLQKRVENESQVGTDVTGVSHNSISKFGQDAGEMIKNGVRETLRVVVKWCDKLISE
ncbi:MAG: hypothetical protein ACRCST_01245 [Turicibacter sp.]